MKDVRVFAGWSCLGLLVVGLAGCAAAPRQRAREGGPVDTGAGTLTSARKFLEGRWSLESFQVFPAGKPPVTIKGQGTVTYDDFSNLTMDVRADEASVQALRDAGVEVTRRLLDDRPRRRGHAEEDAHLRREQGRIDRGPDRAARPEPAALLGGRRGQADADDEGRRRQAAVRERLAPDALRAPRDCARRRSRTTSRRGKPSSLDPADELMRRDKWTWEIADVVKRLAGDRLCDVPRGGRICPEHENPSVVVLHG